MGSRSRIDPNTKMGGMEIPPDRTAIAAWSVKTHLEMWAR
jgi:hypothetical protein